MNTTTVPKGSLGTCEEGVGYVTGTGRQARCTRLATREYRAGSSVDIRVCTIHARSGYADLIPVAEVQR